MTPFLRFVFVLGAAASSHAPTEAGRGLTPGPPTAQIDQEAVSKSTLIFSGVITKLGSATMALVPVSENTLVVRVDKVIKTADPGMDYVGLEITVLVRNPQGFKVGDNYIFYTKGWLAGESVAVQELGNRRVPMGGASDSLLRNIDKSSQIAEEAVVQRRVDKADLIVEGRVVSTEPVEILPSATTEEERKPPLMIEHDPELKRAIIEVVSVVSSKGSDRPRTITVLYPTSQDIKWADMPRLERGDSGLFILSKAETSEEFMKILSLIKGRIEGLEKDYFIADASGYQPRSELERIKSKVRN